MGSTVTKSLIRKTLLHYRRLLDSSEFKHRNDKLLDKLKEFVQENDLQFIHVFLPIARNREPDVTPILFEFLDLGKRIAVSKTNFKVGTMSHFEFNRKTKLEKNKLDIPEPVGAKEVDISEVDLILVPLLLADQDGNRVGYGGGFYDRLLNQTNALKVGLSLSPTVDILGQLDEWDVKLDHIICGID